MARWRRQPRARRETESSAAELANRARATVPSSPPHQPVTETTTGTNPPPPPQATGRLMDASASLRRAARNCHDSDPVASSPADAPAGHGDDDHDAKVPNRPHPPTHPPLLPPPIRIGFVDEPNYQRRPRPPVASSPPHQLVTETPNQATAELNHDTPRPERLKPSLSPHGK
jgi:hypothetical protein